MTVTSVSRFSSAFSSLRSLADVRAGDSSPGRSARWARARDAADVTSKPNAIAAARTTTQAWRRSRFAQRDQTPRAEAKTLRRGEVTAHREQREQAHRRREVRVIEVAALEHVEH